MKKYRIYMLALASAILLSAVSCSALMDSLLNPSDTVGDVGSESVEDITDAESEALPVKEKQILCTVKGIIEENVIHVEIGEDDVEKYGDIAIVVIDHDPYYGRRIEVGDLIRITVSSDSTLDGTVPVIHTEDFEILSTVVPPLPPRFDNVEQVVEYYYSSEQKPELVSFECQHLYLIADIIQSPKSKEKMLLLTYPELDYSKYLYAAISVAYDNELCVGDTVFVDASAHYAYNIVGRYSEFTVIPSEYTVELRKATQTEIDEYMGDIPVPEKPVIYLYPETDTLCSVRLELDGELTCTYPEHGEWGWQNFLAKPDGTLLFPDGGEYYCLYWEGISDMEFDFSQGFCVKGSDTAAFLGNALTEMGLTPREANEFIIYWLPKLQNNPYNIISFQNTAYTDKAKLEIDPAPDSLLRVFMAVYASDTPVNIQPQTFDGFDRKGFCVVEWGGAIVKN